MEISICRQKESQEHKTLTGIFKSSRTEMGKLSGRQVGKTWLLYYVGSQEIIRGVHSSSPFKKQNLKYQQVKVETI